MPPQLGEEQANPPFITPTYQSYLSTLMLTAGGRLSRNSTEYLLLANLTKQTNLTLPADKYTCSVYWEARPDPASYPATIAVFSIVYLTIFVLGLVGNLAVLCVTLQQRTLQTVQNMFILNLAASDIVVCFLSLPLTPVTNIYKNWYFGAVLCRLIPWVQGVSIFICTFSLAAIALDRYVLVCRPHRRPLTRKNAVAVMIALWTVSIVITFPYAVFMKLVEYEDTCGTFCTEEWPDKTRRSARAYTLLVFCFQFIIPFAVMAGCYYAIFAKLKKRARTRLKRLTEMTQALEHSGYLLAEKLEAAAKLQNNDEDAEEEEQQSYIEQQQQPPPQQQEQPQQKQENGALLHKPKCSKQGRKSANNLELMENQEQERHRLLAQNRRTTFILASMVLIFGLSWLPHNIVSLIVEFNENGMDVFTRADGTVLLYLINLFTHSIAMTNNVANPLLYSWLNPVFRDRVLQSLMQQRAKLSVALSLRKLTSKKSTIPHIGGSFNEGYNKSQNSTARSNCTSGTRTPITECVTPSPRSTTGGTTPNACSPRLTVRSTVAWSKNKQTKKSNTTADSGFATDVEMACLGGAQGGFSGSGTAV